MRFKSAKVAMTKSVYCTSVTSNHWNLDKTATGEKVLLENAWKTGISCARSILHDLGIMRSMQYAGYGECSGRVWSNICYGGFDE